MVSEGIYLLTFFSAPGAATLGIRTAWMFCGTIPGQKWNCRRAWLTPCGCELPAECDMGWFWSSSCLAARDNPFCRKAMHDHNTRKVRQKSVALFASKCFNMIIMDLDMMHIVTQSWCHSVLLIIHIDRHLDQSDRYWDDCLDDEVLWISLSPQTWRQNCELRFIGIIVLGTGISDTHSWILEVIGKKAPTQGHKLMVRTWSLFLSDLSNLQVRWHLEDYV